MYDEDKMATEIMDNQVVYVLPRVIGGDVVYKTRSSVEWVIKTKTDEPIEGTVEARCPRAYTSRVKVTLQ